MRKPRKSKKDNLVPVSANLKMNVNGKLFTITNDSNIPCYLRLKTHQKQKVIEITIWEN